MADFFKLSMGDSVIWRDDGGAGMTKIMTLNALASTGAQMGTLQDLGATWDEEYYVMLIVESGTAPTAGTIAILYMACSHDGTTWPAGVSGADASYTTTPKAQLGRPVVVLVATNSTDTEMIQGPVIWRPSGRYVTPVVENNLGQDFRNTTPASDNKSRVIMVPRRTQILEV